MADDFYSRARRPAETSDPVTDFHARATRGAVQARELIQGAPRSIRALVGSASSPESRLATLQGIFPDAQPVIGDPDNFIYTNDEGNTVLYNPRGLDVGDFASLPREGGQALGGTLGAIGGGTLGAPAGPGGSAVGAITGAGIGQAVGDEAAIAAGRLFGAEDLRRPAEVVGNVASNIAFGAGGEGVGMGLGFAGRRGVEALGGAVGAPARAGQAAFRRIGATPTVPQALRGNALLAFETIMSRFPGGAGPLSRRARETVTNIQNFVETQARNVSSRRLEPRVAGRTIETGIEAFANRFKARGGAMFDELAQLIPPTTTVPATNTSAIINELSAGIPGAPSISEALQSSVMRNLGQAAADDIAGGTMTYQSLSGMRSFIGRKLASFDLVSDIPRAELKRIYGALTEDMRAAAFAQGPDAVRAFNQANRFWNAGLDRIDGILENVANRAIPEDVFRAAMAGSREGASRILALSRSLKPEEWQVVVGTVMKRLGRGVPSRQNPTGELFSTETFLTNWAGLDDLAKDALFNRPGLPAGLRGDLDAVAEVSEIFRRSGEMFRNPSGTSGATVGQAMILGTQASLGGAAAGAMIGAGAPEGALIGAAGLILAGLGANVQSRLLTNPTFVKWMAQGQRIAPNGVGSHIGRLGALATQSEDSEFQSDVIEFLDNWGVATGEASAEVGATIPPNIPPPLDQPSLGDIR